MAETELLQAIIDAAQGRFKHDNTSEMIDDLRLLANEELTQPQVIRLSRIHSDNCGWRTILTTQISDASQLLLANRWAADVRGYLCEPETSDLYLIINCDGISPDQILRAEADEQFCRKFVSWPNETPQQLLRRTFLAPIELAQNEQPLLDPLSLALENTADEHQWFDNKISQKWRQLLLSGKTGRDLLELLVETGSIIPTVNRED
ncbi:MAG: hypothetical protein MJK04_04065 [Psychrosphaera sp.]|nr:hypothetical protein [Psychrosphaera sp.]